ncbi:predicted protein [Aspergillus nidulans FGSC A4]|uniref:Uncharacterized protein n=1 Tax=Emericella nidulans (strain FGSC A4 / ATCC 38163 / CBS 112.46 / NRRL 194 / M139) TaxID=227321 RepID=Q5AXN3_EMENI|nr:hypothetical protein [Aspergillus nidulans FGSC A4]EAA57702.1 predicted protein [Aspergillus nidulans FGSC A4]CBF71801.1 TPA: conserved hypothetical protein [Aspergillus nidulans FGSC A4]|eukprot:XP_664551.1 predicted protein [Aspergillus nidulans FGSC A4]
MARVSVAATYPPSSSSAFKLFLPFQGNPRMSFTGGSSASGIVGLPRGFDPAVLTWERLPETGEACIGIAINEENDTLSAPYAGALRGVFTCPFMIWVKPNPGEEDSFVPCTVKDLEHIKSWTLVREPGDQAFGWWIKDKQYNKGTGVIENVGVDVRMLVVQPFPREDKRHIDRWMPGALHRLFISVMERQKKNDGKSVKMLAEARVALAKVEAEQTKLVEEKLSLVKETVDALSKPPGHNRRRPTSYLEDMICRQGPEAQ